MLFWHCDLPPTKPSEQCLTIGCSNAHVGGKSSCKQCRAKFYTRVHAPTGARIKMAW